MKSIYKLNIILVSLTFCVLLTACTGSGLKSGTSVSSTSGATESNFSVALTSAVVIPASRGRVTEMNIKPEKEELHFLKATDTSVRGRLDYFADDDGTEYVFINETGEYIGFSKLKIKPSGLGISENEVRLIADATAAEFADISKYELRESKPIGSYPDENSREFLVDSYDFSYYKTLSGYKTSEGVLVCTLTDGTVRFVGLVDIGKFNGIEEPKIDEKELEQKFLAEVRKQFGHDDVLKIYEQVIECEGSQLFMRYDFEISVEFGHGRKQIKIPI